MSPKRRRVIDAVNLLILPDEAFTEKLKRGLEEASAGLGGLR
jgi:hypothetical protein